MMSREEINLLQDGFFSRLKKELKTLQCEGCQEPRNPEKPNVVPIEAGKYKEVFCKFPMYGVLETAPVGGNVFVLPGRSPADNLQTGTGNPGVVRSGLDLVFPRRGWYTIWNNGTANVNVSMIEAPDGAQSFVAREGVQVVTYAAVTAGVAAGLIVAANPRRRFLRIENIDVAPTDSAMIGFDNTVALGKGMRLSQPVTAANTYSAYPSLSFGPGGDFPLYLGEIWAIRTAGDATLCVVECT